MGVSEGAGECASVVSGGEVDVGAVRMLGLCVPAVLRRTDVHHVQPLRDDRE